MGLITKEVKIKLTSKNLKHFENLGYYIPREKDKWHDLRVPRGTEISVKAKDLLNESKAIVDVQCDNCLKHIPIHYCDYTRYVKSDGKYYCVNCARKLYGIEKGRKARLKNSISFYDWCYKNLTKTEADNIMLRWDYDLNKCSPKNISYASMGFNKKGYYFKCLIYPLEHHSELKNIASFTMGHIGSLNCNQCNSFGQYMINKFNIVNIESYWSNKNLISPFEVDYSSNKSFLLKCFNCGNEKKTSLNRFVRQGLSCNICGDGIPYPEKFMYNLLTQLAIDFEYQYSPKWCKYIFKGLQRTGRYDFYIPSEQIIIEMDGGLGHGNRTLNDITKDQSLLIDSTKDELAKKHGIEPIRIDCNYTGMDEFHYIKENICTNSKLASLFKIDNINWYMIYNNCQNSLVKKTCDIWNKGINNPTNISKILNLNRTTIEKYLKHGTKLGWCNYNPKEMVRKNHILIGQMNVKRCSKKVYCIELQQLYSSTCSASRHLNIDQASICKCCNKKYGFKTAGGYHWMYYEDYLKEQKAS